MSGIFGMIGAAAGLAGSKPTVPNLPTIDPQQEQAKAISGNLAALPSAEKLASGVNLFNQQELLNMLTRSIPGYADIQKSESAAIQSLLKGEVSDVNQRATQSAAKAAGLGITGSRAAESLTLRDLGISSLAATEAGLTAADRWMRTTDAMTNPGLFNATSMFVSPAQQIAVDTNERNATFNRDWLSNQISAMPGPLEKEAMGTLDYFDSLGKAALGAELGGMMGGGMGAGGGSMGGSSSDWNTPYFNAGDAAAISKFNLG